MPIRTALWKVGLQPQPLAESSLDMEQLLEDIIVTAPRMLSDEWMLIGRQEDTGFGGRIDLLAIAPDGSLVLIELKRDRTPREVVAQALDYASWVEKLRAEDIAAIYCRFASGIAPGSNHDFRHKLRIGVELHPRLFRFGFSYVPGVGFVKPGQSFGLDWVGGGGPPFLLTMGERIRAVRLGILIDGSMTVPSMCSIALSHGRDSTGRIQYTVILRLSQYYTVILRQYEVVRPSAFATPTSSSSNLPDLLQVLQNPTDLRLS